MLKDEFDRLLEDLRAHARLHGLWLMSGFLNGTLQGPLVQWESPLVRVRMSPTTAEMEILRRENKNPVLGIRGDGTLLRYHGEFSTLQDHLLVQVYGDPRRVRKETREALVEGIRAEAQRMRDSARSLSPEAEARVTRAASSLEETARRILCGVIPDPTP